MISVDQIAKGFGDLKVIEEISFKANFGEIICILGPSGCGKSTLLNIIAGLIEPDVGKLESNFCSSGKTDFNSFSGRNSERAL